MYKPKKPAPDARIIKLREYEDRLARMQGQVKDHHDCCLVADWEKVTDKKIANNNVMRTFEQLKAQRAAALDARRAALARKLHEEDMVYAKAIEDLQETADQRRARLTEKARSLAARREDERKALAASLLEQRFRDDCDPLRALYSQQIVLRTVEEREAQVEEKRQRIQIESAERAAFDRMYELERLKKEKRYLDDSKRRKEQQVEMQRALDEQIRLKLAREAEDAEVHANETRRLQETWQRCDDEAQAAEREEEVKAAELAETVRLFNEEKQRMDAEKLAEEDRLDREFLRMTLDREAAEAAREAEEADKRREEMRRFREHMALQMEKEKADNSVQDRIIAQYQAAQHAKEDAIQAARSAARAQLMDEVHAARRAQIAEKHEAAAIAHEAALEERDRMMAEEEQMAGIEAEYKAKLRRVALEQRLDVQAQMAAKAQQKRIEKAEAVREHDTILKQEAEFKEHVQSTCQRVEPPKFYGRKKVEWFH